MNCPLCDTQNKEIYLTKDEVNLYKCKCGLGYLWPQPDLFYGKDYYDNYGEEGYLAKKKSKALSSTKFLEKVESYVPRIGTLVEVGSATGFLLEVARDRGWHVWGVEKSDWARKYAYDKLNIRSSMMLQEPPVTADAVIMLNTIEHVMDPISFIKEVRDIMMDDGILLMTTPNFDDIRYLRNHRANNPNIEKQHNFYFNIKTITKLLEDNRFEVLKISCPLLSRMADGTIVKKQETKKKIMSNPLFRVLKKFDNSRYGSTIEIIARKKCIHQD